MASDPEGQNEVTAAQPPDQVAAEGSVVGASPSDRERAVPTPDGDPAAASHAPPTAAIAPPDEEGDETADAAALEDTADTDDTDADGPEAEDLTRQWYILKVQVNREESIRRALERRVKVAGLERFFGDIVVPTEDVAEYNKSGKRRVVKRKLYPGYLMIHLALNDETWFLVRETPGIGDFTGSAGKPTPMELHEVQRIVKATQGAEAGEAPIKTAIPFRPGDRVRVKEGYFENFEGDVESIDEANGRVTVMINIFGRSTPVELEHWQIESV